MEAQGSGILWRPLRPVFATRRSWEQYTKLFPLAKDMHIAISDAD